MNKIKTNYLWEIGASIAAISFYLLMFYRIWIHFSLTGYFSSLLLLIFEGFVICLFLVRKIPKESSMSVYDWSIALIGTCLPTIFIATGGSETTFLHAAQIAGMLVSLSGVASLNRSFGLVAANRGVKTSGVYKYIRHPIYAGYFISFLAFFLQNKSAYNAVILALFCAAQVLRIFAEEKFLCQDDRYREYTKRVRWRLCPFVF